MSNSPVGIGFIGAGMISETYLENLTSFPDVKVHSVGDLDVERAEEQARKHGVESWGSAEDVLANPDVEVIVNLTIPAVHAEVALASIEAGKHVWTEKPISVDRGSGQALVERAHQLGKRVGVAPDTVLGPGIQTARRAIERGDIGVPLSAQTVMQYFGPDVFHPNPDFLFAQGAGPLFDMGPYYIASLVHIFGSIDRVAAVGSIAQQRRTVQVGPRAGESFPVEVPTHVSAIAHFESGAVSQSVLSFDSPLASMGQVIVTGTEGTMSIPDPNSFSGEVKITRGPREFSFPIVNEWETVPEQGVVTGRGLGVLEMARAIRANRPHIATGELGLHVLDAMIGIEESISTGQFVSVESRVERVPTLPLDFDPFQQTL
ncbi:Gfo/Idh/MocA family oxidoreductase [Lysinibacter sp. HNR]|uniref:Gfo/Idh/MocA family protein n=1 Tax=Lysinibacter sp. HNR TaxID=3031408 RepID=UPI00243534C4|nr:Gfo/Idh/MocA family oxidoreductase [Lysinibacter sp. HNR]WGD37288.1 Gfo/Idh/MocA family oxidoreductase [Lysinibacter sp. HNR]